MYVSLTLYALLVCLNEKKASKALENV
jgi:hypothetical protein